MENNTFTYQYSAVRNKKIEKIREKYMPHQESKLETLKKLDAKVSRPANIFAYVFGSISAIIMGAGMSLVMTDIGATVGIESTILSGIAIGVAGMIMALVNYPIYKGILNKRKKKYGADILKLSENILNKYAAAQK